MKSLTEARLYGILDFAYVASDDMEKVAQKLLDGGIDLLQLRAKHINLSEIAQVAARIIRLCRAHGVPFILNDYPELARELGADGVHVGQDDGSIRDVRRIVGDTIFIGRSTHSLDQARQALIDGADYIGFGPLYPTPTKAGRPAIGLEEIRQMELEIGSKIPAFCIGGIQPKNLSEVFSAGARRCVIVSYLLTAEDISLVTAEVSKSIASLNSTL